MKALVKLGLVVLLVAFAVASIGFLIPALSQTTITQNYFSVKWTPIYQGLSHFEYEIEVQNLDSNLNRDFDLSVFFSNTSFPFGQIKNIEIKEWKGVNKTYPVYGIETVAKTCQNLQNISYDCSFNKTVQTGTQLRSTASWKPTKMGLVAQGDITKASYGLMNIPKLGSAPKIDDFGTVVTDNGVKKFRISFDMPIVKTTDGWGSKGTVGIIDEITGNIYHPDWFSNYQNRKQQQVNQTGNIALTNLQYMVNGTTGFNIACSGSQFVWSLDNVTSSNTTTNYLYYNDCNDYVVVNGSNDIQLPYYVENNGSGRASYNPNDAFAGVHTRWDFTYTNGTHVNDTTGNNRNGRLFDSSTVGNNATFGLFVNSYESRGIAGTRVQRQVNDNLLNSSNNWAIEFWVRFNALGGRRDIFTTEKQNGDFVTFIIASGGAPCASAPCWYFDVGKQGTGDTFCESTTNAPSVGGWNHVVLTYSSSDNKQYGYVNGTFLCSSTYTNGNAPSGVNGFSLGCNSDGTNCANAQFDELNLYNSNLSADFVKRRFQMNEARLLSEESGGSSVNETAGRSSIEQGIRASLGGDAPIYTDQQIYARYVNTSQQLGRFDKVTKFSNQIWAFNYVNDTAPFTNMQNITPAFYVFEMANRSSGSIRDAVSNLINVTKVS